VVHAERPAAFGNMDDIQVNIGRRAPRRAGNSGWSPFLRNAVRTRDCGPCGQSPPAASTAPNPLPAVTDKQHRHGSQFDWEPEQVAITPVVTATFRFGAPLAPGLTAW